MIKRSIKYTDYNGNNREEDFYFHLSDAEMAEWEASEEGGMSAKLKEIVDSKDTNSLIQIFKKIILKAYGIKSADGKRFIKSDEISKEFTQTEAYSILFMELAQDADKAEKFIKGLNPKIGEAEKQSK